MHLAAKSSTPRRHTATHACSAPHGFLLPAGLTLAALALLFGCASPGPPRAPSLQLPQPVRDLSAERFGNQVDLHWTVPTLSTDRQPLLRAKHSATPLTAELCRSEAASPTCIPLQQLQVTPGTPAAATDNLPPTLQTGPPRLLRYHLRLLNNQGRGAPNAAIAEALAGSAPAPLTSLAAATTDAGIQLTWQRQPAYPLATIRLQAQTPDSNRRRNLLVPADPGGTIDPAPAVGQSITYTVFRTVSLTLDGHTLPLSGSPATVTVTRAPDTFPPATPTGLLAIAAQFAGKPPEIDLSWKPNPDPDLLGYHLDRTDTTGPAAAGPAAPTRLTPAPTPALSFRDTAVQPGHTYRYTLTAVDRSGNQSPPSPAITESLHP